MKTLAAPLVWKPKHSTSHAETDGQHQQLIVIANELLEALHHHKSSAVLRDRFDSLIAFARQHFADEESAMRDLAYPDLAEHKEEHDRLIKQVVELQRQIDTGEKAFSMDVIYFIRHWIMHHVVTTDAVYGAYLDERNDPSQ